MLTKNNIFKCSRCGISDTHKILTRINQKGEVGIFWCMDCIRTEKPSLYTSIFRNRSDIERDLEKIFYSKNHI